MAKQTKLVNCGATVFVYDFKSRDSVKDLGFEKDIIRGSITDLKRLLLTNFVDDRSLATFSLKVPLNDYNGIQSKLNHFFKHIKKLLGHSTIKYLGVLELPSEKYETYSYIKLITNIESHELTIVLDEVHLEKYEDESDEGYDDGYFEKYYEEIWGDTVFINEYSPGDLLEVFSSAYSNSITRNNSWRYSKIMFQHQLKYPLILWNEEAEAFIKNHNLLAFTEHTSDEIYDELAGFVITNEYSLYDTRSSIDELRFNCI